MLPVIDTARLPRNTGLFVFAADAERVRAVLGEQIDEVVLERTELLMYTHAEVNAQRCRGLVCRGLVLGPKHSTITSALPP